MRRTALLALMLSLAACESSRTEPPPSSPAAEEQEPAPEATAEPTPEPEREICARVIVVAWAGAPHAASTVTRTREQAREHAQALRTRVVGGEDFATIARAESDAVSSGPRGGLLGTYVREDWPAAHEPIREPLWSLGMDETSEVLEAPYGWVIAQRCPVEHVHTRHILVRYAGARNAPADMRSREQAQDRAAELLREVRAEGADFAAIARAQSEDGSRERGGDVGVTGRGRLAQAYEEAAYALAPGEIAGPIETEFGFHVIQRFPE